MVGRRLIVLMTIVLMACAACQETDSPVAGQRACVTAASPEAVQAGHEILMAGGNAADAAVAVAFALGVTEPAMSGLGGGMQILYAPAGATPVSINGTTWSPHMTSRNASDTLSYHRRSTVPGTVKALDLLHRQYGSGMAWEALLAPAIKLADEGFVVGTFRHRVYKRTERILLNSPYLSGQLLRDDGTIPAAGDTLRQPVLARTMARLATAGGDDFYHGEIARTIADDMASRGGWIALADLQSFPEPTIRPALHVTHQGYDVYTAPPPAGGYVALLALNLIAADPAITSRATTLQLARVLNAAHGVRRGSPQIRYDSVMLTEALSAGFAETLIPHIYQERPAGHDASDGGETTHFSIVDLEGNAIAVTASINAYFGAAALAPDLGFLYNSYMDDFVFGDTAHVDAIAPNAAAYSSMSPTIVQQNGETRLVIGSPGSARIISSVAQLVHIWTYDRPPIDQLLRLPRVHAQADRVYLEDPQWDRRPFREAGLTVAHPTYDLIQNSLNAYFGGVHAIARTGNGWTGGADPRRDGAVMYIE